MAIHTHDTEVPELPELPEVLASELIRVISSSDCDRAAASHVDRPGAIDAEVCRQVGARVCHPVELTGGIELLPQRRRISSRPNVPPELRGSHVLMTERHPKRLGDEVAPLGRGVPANKER